MRRAYGDKISQDTQVRFATGGRGMLNYCTFSKYSENSKNPYLTSVVTLKENRFLTRYTRERERERGRGGTEKESREAENAESNGLR